MAADSRFTEPALWAEFVMLSGSRDHPQIIGRRDLGWAFDMISELLAEHRTVEAAKAAYEKTLSEWLRHV